MRLYLAQTIYFGSENWPHSTESQAQPVYPLSQAVPSGRDNPGVERIVQIRNSISGIIVQTRRKLEILYVDALSRLVQTSIGQEVGMYETISSHKRKRTPA